VNKIVDEEKRSGLLKDSAEEADRLFYKYTGQKLPYQIVRNDLAATLLQGYLKESLSDIHPGRTESEVKRKMVEKMSLYEVTMVYGENRTEPIIKTKRVVAPDTGVAKARAGFLPQPEWDLDYYNLVAKPIMEVNIKEKPTEIKSV
jgi:hypothetical protein